MDEKKVFLRLVVDHNSAGSSIKGIYLITDEEDRLLERVRAALPGGVTVLQYRNKSADKAAAHAMGSELKKLCIASGVAFIVNDDTELALALDADGVHLGQEDGDPAAARSTLGPKKIIGISTHSLAEALAAEAAGADYIGFGAMFPTASKEIKHLPGPTALAEIKANVRIPVVAIGGISRDNAPEVIDNGADAIAVISAILASREPGLAAAELALLFNRKTDFPRGSVLTIAGSDSGGGAGIQADLKTITLLGSYGASAITALTAQNTRGVNDIQGVSPEFAEEQIEAVLSDIRIDVVKTGMLYTREIAEVVADKLDEYCKRIVVIDPVMVAKGGVSLLEGDAMELFKKRLLASAYLLTPNIPEAEKLTGVIISDEGSMEKAARILHRMGARNVLIKGGHLPEGVAVDILYDGSTFTRFAVPRLLTRNTHGTGCTLASAIATFLAQGEPLPVAVAKGKKFVTAAIKFAQPLGKGHGPVNHFLAAREMEGRDREPGVGNR